MSTKTKKPESAAPSGAAAAKPKPKVVKSDVVYSINEERQIIRTKGESEGVVLAQLVGEEGSLPGLQYENAQTRKMHPQVIRFLEDEKLGFNTDAVTVKDDAELEDNDTSIDSEHTKEFNSRIPAPPKKTPESGDKTPAYVDWLRKYKPKTYAQKYGIVGEGQVTNYIDALDDRGRPTKKAVTKDAILARRKTHRTEKLEAGDPNEQE